jgi:cysteine synthase A
MNILDTIGQTPLIKVNNIFAKLETTNPSGSIKDRMTSYMIRQAERRGDLKKGDTIIEVTSGNTGISFAMIATVKGYKFIAVMPDSMSLERKKMMKMFGADVILTEGEKDMIGAIKEYKKIIKKKNNIWLPDQFKNPDNFLAHQKGLGQEILKQKKDIDVFVAGVGTGGTLIGVAKALKKENSKIKIIAVEPEESAVLSGQKAGPHYIQGIGEGFVTPILEQNRNLIDEVITIKSKDAIFASKKLAREYGILVGFSSGANFLAAQQLKNEYKNVVTVFPDRGERYLS